MTDTAAPTANPRFRYGQLVTHRFAPFYGVGVALDDEYPNGCVWVRWATGDQSTHEAARLAPAPPQQDPAHPATTRS